MAQFHRRLSFFAIHFVASALLCATGVSASALPLDSVIAPHFGTTYISETRKSSSDTSAFIQGYRYSLRIDFMSLSNNVSVNLLSGMGANYLDFGAQLRVFDLLAFGPSSRSGLFYGAGAGFTYSPGFSSPEIEKLKFIETALTAFVRMQWDTNSGWGIFTEVAYEGVLQRTLLSIPVDEDKSSSHRAVMSVGIPFEVDL